MQVNEIYCVCNFPTMPDPFVKMILDSVGKVPQYSGTKRVSAATHRELFNNVDIQINNTTYTRAGYSRYEVPEVVVKWVRKNVCENFSQIGVHIMGNGGAFSPHTDGGPRQYILNYIVDLGGSAVETKWWQEKGHSPIREGAPLQFSSTDNLELLTSTVFDNHAWTMLYGKIIHSVSNITSKRVALTIALSREEFLTLKEKYNLDLVYYAGE